MSLRKLLFPFSLLYGTAVLTRNKLYDADFLKSKKYDLPIICVGNLNVGGTGKSPMVEYLLNLLKKEHKVATLSRGYKRNSKGFYLLEGTETAEQVGDEPLQFKNKFETVFVAVDEDRQHGIAELLKIKNPDVIVLDDAFQHRKVTAGFYILLTAYGDLYANDLILPAGNLREGRSGAKRADCIVVTKCPKDISREEMEKIEQKLQPEEHQQVFFTRIKYSDSIKNANGKKDFSELKIPFTLVTGIASPKPLIDFLKSKKLKFDHLEFPDHHHFSDTEIHKINKSGMVITTEKDYMRLKGRLPEQKLFYLPIEVDFIEKEELFTGQVEHFVNKKWSK